MKEYLVKDPQTGKYWATTDKDERGIVCEIPEGAEILAETKSGLIFYRKYVNDSFLHRFTNDEKWSGTHTNPYAEVGGFVVSIVWQRKSTSTQVEYLNPADWSLHVVDVDNDAAGKDWIKVPDGAEWAKLWDEGEQYQSVEFYRGHNEFFSETKQEWMRGHDQSTNKVGQPARIVWDRRMYVQPEELPFIDDDFVVKGATETLSTTISFSLIDDEPKTVNDTLSERQSQYGCFEDVAFVTENIISIMKKCNFDNMPHPHKMAMYMIVSKMARIVNGDFNHKDSWHDIQGYAKLIENLIGGEK